MCFLLSNDSISNLNLNILFRISASMQSCNSNWSHIKLYMAFFGSDLICSLATRPAVLTMNVLQGSHSDQPRCPAWLHMTAGLQWSSGDDELDYYFCNRRGPGLLIITQWRSVIIAFSHLSRAWRNRRLAMRRPGPIFPTPGSKNWYSSLNKN